MTKAERYKEIEKIWKKHATGKQNLIATYLELIEFIEGHPSLPKPNIQKV